MAYPGSQPPSDASRSNRIRGAIEKTTRCLRTSIRRHNSLNRFNPTEALERRFLLSAYAINNLGYLGGNETGDDSRSTLVADSDGDFFGTTYSGGVYDAGSVFELPKGSNQITDLASFNGTDGQKPCAGVTLDGSGNLYGATTAGGANGLGTVFEIASGSNAVTALSSFSQATGGSGYGGVILDASGSLYGAAEQGGALGDGTIYEIPSGSGTITTLASFNGPDGANPFCPLTRDSAGDLYGTTANGGAANQGSVFELPAGSSTLSVLASFTGNSAPNPSGSNPMGGVVLDGSGNLFGTTPTGSLYSGGTGGTVFEVAAGSNAITTLVSFTLYSGVDPQAGLSMDEAGNLYGTTKGGGSYQQGYGTLFEIPSGSASLQTLASFDGSNGQNPIGGVLIDSSDNLYGTAGGGANKTGCIYERTSRPSLGVTALASFAADSNSHGVPSAPGQGLTLDASGDLFGTTTHGGGANQGTVFEVVPGSQAVRTLAWFNGTNGELPQGQLVVDTSGNIYGTTQGGGANLDGTIFQIVSGSNTITTLASFNGTNGRNPLAGLAVDAAGNLYGTCSGGGAYSDGSVFEVAAGSKTITTVASFNGANGHSSAAKLTLDMAGDLFGTTETGGANDVGTIFEVAKDSKAITVLASFSTTSINYSLNAGYPDAPVAIDTAGNLYGTTAAAPGANPDGTVYELPAGSGIVTTLASFNGTDGKYPYAGVTIDPAGNVFGTTYYGGTNNSGTVFEIGHGSNAITTLFAFSPDASGQYPNGELNTSGLARDPSGDLFGVTDAGTIASQGAVFELIPNTSTSLSLTGGTNPSDISQACTFAVRVTGGVPDGQNVVILDASNNNATVAIGALTSGSVSLTVPAGTLSVGTHSLIAIFGGDANFAASQSAPTAQTVNSDSLPSYITASPGAAYGYDSVTGDLNLTSGNLTFTADNTAATIVNLTASGPASGVFFDTSEHLAGLTLSGGAQATVLSLGSARTHSNHNVLVIGAVGSAANPTFSIDSQSKLDLTDNDLIVHTGSSDNGNGVPNQLGVAETNELGNLRALALIGRNVAAGSVLDGTWTGNGLTSSSAASVDANAGYEQNVLAVVQNSDQILGKLSNWTVGSFSEPLGSNDILVKFTYNGDAALEGFVGDNSVTIVNGFYDGGKSTQADWAFGDFTDNGKVDDNDITILNGLYGNGTAGSGLPQL